jgi:tRNA G18 (ribose-2'-O)-methylase SpoU
LAGVGRIISIDSLDDQRVSDYGNLKDRELARRGDRFIAEGELVVRRLVASRYPCLSILCSQRIVEEIAPLVSDEVPVYVAPDQEINRIVGFKFHHGCLAVGKRISSGSMDDLLTIERSDGCRVVLACEDINSAENLGSMLRTAAGLGVAGVVLGPQCVDPFWRLCVRVSMGNVFSMPIVRSDDLPRDLGRFTSAGFATLATVCHPPARAIWEISSERPERVVLVMGGEAQGLTEAAVRACRDRVTIPMKLGTDSLNVALAAAIGLYELTRGSGLST